MKRTRTSGGGLAVVVGALGVLVGLAAIAVREWPSLQPGQGAVLGGTAVLGAALVTFYSQHQTRAEDARQHTERERREMDVALRERYAKVAEQVADQSPAIRLAGVYALGSLADDWLALKRIQEWRVCLDLMKAYMRVPEVYNTRGAMEWSDETRKAAIDGEREVRRTTLRLAFEQASKYRLYWIQVELQAELRWMRSNIFSSLPRGRWRPPGPPKMSSAFPPPGMQRLDLRNCDLSGLALNGLDLSFSDFTNSNLTEAELFNVNLTGAKLDGADLAGIAYDGRTKWPEGFSPPPTKVYVLEEGQPESSFVTGSVGQE